MRASTNPGRAAAGCLAAFLLLSFAGCGNGTKHEFAEVTGKVTLDQKPLDGVVVTFYPDNDAAEQQPYATGKTDASGTYTLTSTTGPAGALLGKNRVIVNWPPKERREDPDKLPRIPVDYMAVTQTPFLFEVKAGGRQTIDLPMKK